MQENLFDFMNLFGVMTVMFFRRQSFIFNSKRLAFLVLEILDWKVQSIIDYRCFVSDWRLTRMLFCMYLMRLLLKVLVKLNNYKL